MLLAGGDLIESFQIPGLWDIDDASLLCLLLTVTSIILASSYTWGFRVFGVGEK